MKRRLSVTMLGNISKAILCWVLCVWMACMTRAQQLDSIPDRGFQPSGSYAFTDIETINTTNGDLTLRVPVGSLPPGRGGNPGFTLQLLYNSKIWDSKTDIAPDPLNPNRTVDVH